MLKKGVCLLQYNARSLTTRATQELLVSLEGMFWAHPQHVPDLSPIDFHMLSRLGGNIFENDQELKHYTKVRIQD